METPTSNRNDRKGWPALSLPMFLAVVGLSLLVSVGAGAQENGQQEDQEKTPAEHKTTIMEGLHWLSRHQSDDGHWGVYNYREQCDEDGNCKRYVEENRAINDFGVTGLAVLAFVNAGIPLNQKSVFKGERLDQSLRKGVNYLKKKQNDDGSFFKAGNKPMYKNAIATLAMARAYGRYRMESLKKPVKKSLTYIKKARSRGKGWRYTYQSGDSDVSVTSWCVSALTAGREAGFDLPRKPLRQALEFVDSTTEKNYYQTGYRKKEQAGLKVRVPGKNDKYANHPALSSISMMIRLMVKKKRAEQKILMAQSRLLMDDLPTWPDGISPNSKGNPVDFYYWYYGTKALRLAFGPGGSNPNSKYWNKWRRNVSRVLSNKQKTDPSTCSYGSWKPIGRWCFEGGRVYATVINVSTLGKIYGSESAVINIPEERIKKAISIVETLNKNDVPTARKKLKNWDKQDALHEHLDQFLNGVEHLQKDNHKKALKMFKRTGGNAKFYAGKLLEEERKQSDLSSWVKQMVDQLGHKSYKKRQEATRTLKEIRPYARPQLENAASSDNAEKANRAREILK